MTVSTRDATSETERSCARTPHAVFAECPHCGGGMQPEHAHYRCSSCGWRDSCCD